MLKGQVCYLPDAQRCSSLAFCASSSSSSSGWAARPFLLKNFRHAEITNLKPALNENPRPEPKARKLSRGSWAHKLSELNVLKGSWVVKVEVIRETYPK